MIFLTMLSRVHQLKVHSGRGVKMFLAAEAILTLLGAEFLSYVDLFVCLWVCVCSDAPVEVRGQLAGISSLLYHVCPAS